jgi:hypothetical protein
MRVLAGKWTMAAAERRMSWSSGASSGHDFRGTIGSRGTETRSPVVSGEPHGVRAGEGEVVRLQSAEERR